MVNTYELYLNGDIWKSPKILRDKDVVKSILDNKEIKPIHVDIDAIEYCNLRCKFCIDGNSNIMMANFTYKKIKDINTGDIVIGFDELEPRIGHYKRIYPVKVINTFKRKSNTIKITLEDGNSLEVTPNHLLLSNRGHKESAWRPASKFKIGQEIRINPYMPFTSCKINLDYKLGYLVGIVLGDGHLSTYDGKYKSSKYTRDEYLSKCKMKNGRFGSSGKKNIIKNYNITQFRVAVSDEEIIDRLSIYLRDLGIAYYIKPFDIHRTGKKENFKPSIHSYKNETFKKIKNIINQYYHKNNSYNYVCGFLAGIYDAEGHIDKKNRVIRICNTDIEIINEIERCLDMINIPYKREINISNKENLKIMYIVRILSPLNTFNHLKFIQIVMPAIKRKGIKNFYNIRMSDSKRIVDIQESKETNVYNLETKSGTYIANNFFIHNCFYHGKKTTIMKDSTFNGKGLFPYNRLIDLIDELKLAGTESISFTGSGETLLYPQIYDIFQKIIDNDMEYGITTNLNVDISDKDIDILSKASWIRCSLNASTQQNYKKVHNPYNKKECLNRVIDNIKRLPNINISYLIFPGNVSDIAKTARLVKYLGANCIFFKLEMRFERDKNIKGEEYRKKIYLEIERARELEDENFKIYETNEYIDIEDNLKCYLSNHMVYIDSNGDVYPCCVTKYNKKYIIGNILNKKFVDFWNSDERRNNYNKLNMKCCPPCPRYIDNSMLELLYNDDKIFNKFI